MGGASLVWQGLANLVSQQQIEPVSYHSCFCFFSPPLCVFTAHCMISESEIGDCKTRDTLQLKTFVHAVKWKIMTSKRKREAVPSQRPLPSLFQKTNLGQLLKKLH